MFADSNCRRSYRQPRSYAWQIDKTHPASTRDHRCAPPSRRHRTQPRIGLTPCVLAMRRHRPHRPRLPDAGRDSCGANDHIPARPSTRNPIPCCGCSSRWCARAAGRAVGRSSYGERVGCGCSVSLGCGTVADLAAGPWSVVADRGCRHGTTSEEVGWIGRP